ncbi:MAG: ABC transporter transmembrane domain-containing protein, partial [Erysipelotrichaceae bacterium]|nr:ABC transporter transmembrane domain-containing protein [Erysipelotrichaceae bacterium]
MSSENKNVRLPFFGIPKILPYVKKYRKRIALMILMGITASLIDSVFPLFTRYAIDHFIGEQTLDTVWIFILLFIGVLVFQVTINYISVYWSGMTEMDVDRDLRDASFNHLQTLSFAYFNQNNVGYIHARVMSDTGKIGELVAWRMMDI